MRDPLEDVDVRVTRPWVWVFAFIGLALALSILFPSQLAVFWIFLALPFVIFLHELGHFVTAKRAGMKVTEFFVGFGPRIWSTTRGETEYGLKAIPLGGYCRIIGMTNLEEVDPEDEPRAYRSKAFAPKVIVAAAGPTTHFVIAFVLMFGVLWLHGDRSEAAPTTTIGRIEVDSPADDAGLMPGDTVLAVDGVAITEYRQLQDEIRSHNPNDRVTFEIDRDGGVREIDVVLEELTINDETHVRAGIAPEAYIPQLSFTEAIGETPGKTWDAVSASVGALGDMFSPSGIANYFGILSNDEDADENQRFVSAVGFTRAGSQALDAGFVWMILLLISVNIFIGLFNLLPILPFDGGHIAIATYEKVASTIMRRPVHADAAKLLPLTGVVVAVLAFIFFSSVYLDIVNPADNPF